MARLGNGIQPGLCMLWLLAFAGAAPMRAAEPIGGTYMLGAVPVAATKGIVVSETAAIAVEVYPAAPLTSDDAARKLARMLPVQQSADGSVRVLLDGRPRRVDGEQPPTQPTFVIDYDERSVQNVVEAVRVERGGTPDIDQLVAFVAAYIYDKNLRRPFDVASVVARRREGDCTEHAVLLTALLRAFGHRSRVVSGLLLVQDDAQVRAFGHAWSEVDDDGSWRVADAAAPSRGEHTAYLPLHWLADESPAYVSDLVAAPHLARIRLEPLAAVASDPR